MTMLKKEQVDGKRFWGQIQFIVVSWHSQRGYFFPGEIVGSFRIILYFKQSNKHYFIKENMKENLEVGNCNFVTPEQYVKIIIKSYS